MPSKTLTLAKDSPLHKRIVGRLEARYNMAYKRHQEQHSTWERAEELTLAYIPEVAADSARREKRERGEPKYTTIQIPYTYALLMSAHTYWTSVFFARSPVHQFSGRHGEGEQQIQALEALIAYQIDVGGALGPYYIWLYDAGKYGHGVLGQYWDVERISYGQIVEMEDPNAPGKMVLMQATQEVEGYRGNRVYNVSPYDFLHDPRVPMSRFQDGEFCLARKRLGWDKVLERAAAGYFMNLAELKDHAPVDRGRTDGSGQLRRPDFAEALYDDTDKTHPAGAVLWECYIKIVPSEWGLGGSNLPQQWCFTVTEDFGLLVGATPLGYIHGRFPFDVLEPEVEGYGIYNRGIPETMEPIQNTMDWLINTHFFNVRSALNIQAIVDPSKLVIRDVENTGAGFLWRLRPEAYGEDITKMFHQIPVNDVTRAHMTDVQSMLQIGERTLGINDQIMGALGSSGGRRTATEVRATTGFGVNRLKTVTEYMSATGFGPHAQKLVQTSQQYYDVQAKLRRVGSLAMEAGERFLVVRPQDIVGYYDFVNVDGTLPVDRMAQANLWKELMGGLRMMPPQVAMSYDWGRIFAWVATLAGLKNINQFKMQVVPDAQLAMQAQAGNVIPMPARQNPGLPSPVQPGNSASTAAGLNALGGEGGDYAG